MSNQQDSASFDDSKLQQEFKQTASFFNPSNFQQQIRPQREQQKMAQKPPLELTFKPSSEMKKLQANQRNEHLLQQTLGRKNNQSLKNLTKVQVKSAQQLPKHQSGPSPLSKLSSPVKMTKTPSLKPYSPPQPKPVLDSSPLHYNASLIQSVQSQTNKQGTQQERNQANINFYQQQIKRIKEQEQEMFKKELNDIYKTQLEQPAIDPRIQQFQKKLLITKHVTQSRESEGTFNGEVSMADLTPFQPGRILIHNKLPKDQNENKVRMSSQQDYPSYQKSLLESNRINQNHIEQHISVEQQQMQKSNSSAFLPKINPQFKLQTTINSNQLIGYGSIGQSQQETAIRSNSSKQTISPNEFINLIQPTIEDSLLRKSKTAQESMRESQAIQQQTTKFTYKLNSAEPQQQQIESLPQIHSPSSGTQQGFAFGQSKGKSFLQRKPQAKIISRLFSSKSDNNN